MRALSLVVEFAVDRGDMDEKRGGGELIVRGLKGLGPLGLAGEVVDEVFEGGEHGGEATEAGVG